MIDNGYLDEGMGREPREETVPEPCPDEAMVFKEFFTVGLRMPPHPVLADILLKFQIQIHQLTPNIFG
jgi:tRNA A37 threonylcarbamoyladenosine synthetase subunit TsaC/SUA5/YrdC